MRIKALRNTAASGTPIEAGKEYDIPGDISEADAKTLISLGKVMVVPAPAAQERVIHLPQAPSTPPAAPPALDSQAAPAPEPAPPTAAEEDEDGIPKDPDLTEEGSAESSAPAPQRAPSGRRK